MSDLFKNCLTKLKKLFAEDDTASKDSRIESAKITSNRLKALQRMRMNSPTTPDYKLDNQTITDSPGQPTRTANVSNIDNVDLDFGMKIGKV
ncbi:MAG: hypothetical protein SGJ27_05785 [Candidatus Melainabacteria bacterium]|nr:hypothetical protein [Candidatus Melainabacteria bacterium]